jgi:hypothetical protein
MAKVGHVARLPPKAYGIKFKVPPAWCLNQIYSVSFCLSARVFLFRWSAVAQKPGRFEPENDVQLNVQFMKHTQEGVSCLKVIVSLTNTKREVDINKIRELAQIAQEQINSFLPTHFRMTQWILENGGSESFENIELARDLANEFEGKHKNTSWAEVNWDDALAEFQHANKQRLLSR